MDYHVTPSTIMDVKAVAGDTIYLSGGTYRGTYTIASGVTLVGNGDTCISGLDVIRDFLHNNGVYRAEVKPLIPLGGSMGADQVFIDGEEVLEARWPMATVETRGDISTWAEAVEVSDITTDGSTFQATYRVEGLPGGDLVGYYAHVLNGHQWISVGGQVIASGGGAVTISFPNDGKEYNIPTPGSRFYLWGGPLLPDGFYIEGGLLHLRSDPSSKVVEVKARHWGLDLRGSSNVTVKGIRLQSCSIRTDNATTGLILDSMGLYNITHFQAPTIYWWGPPCITLRDGGRITNSVVDHCAGGFANLRGDGCLVDNVTVRDMSYSGCCQAAISLVGSNHTVSRSTLGKAGSSGLLDTRKATDCTIRGCEVYGGGGILTDGGSVMFADSNVTTDQGNRIIESVIHDTRGRTGHNLYGNAGIYIEQRASVYVSECYIWGVTSIDLQVVALGYDTGHVVVERCTLDSLNITYSGGDPTIPITYSDNIVGYIKNGPALKAAAITRNHIARHPLAGNTHAPNIFSTLDGGGYPGPYTPATCGALREYYYGAYSSKLEYTPSVTRDKVDGTVRVRLDGPPPPDGFTVKVGPRQGVVRQYILPHPHLVITFPPSVRGEVDVELSAPTCRPKTLRLTIPGGLRVDRSTGMTIKGAGFIASQEVKVVVAITSIEESWDVPIPVPVSEYIDGGLMDGDGTGISTREGFPLYVDNTYPIGGTQVWVRVPYIPIGISHFTLLLGGNDNVSNAGDVFLVADFHLRDDLYTAQATDGIDVTIEGTDLVIAGTTTTASKFGYAGIRVTTDYLYNGGYPTRSFSWDSYISMKPNSAGYWQSGLGNNSFSLCKGGTTVTATSNQASTLGRQFTKRLVSNIQLPSSMLWQEDLTTINMRDGLPSAKGIFNLMVGQVGKTIDYRFHYIRVRGVPDSGVLPTIEAGVDPMGTRVWIGGVEYTSYLSDVVAANNGDISSSLLMTSKPPLEPGAYDLKVVLDNGEEYTLSGGYEVPKAGTAPAKTPVRVHNPPSKRELLHGPLSSRPPTPNPGQVYISHEGMCYAYLGGVWMPYQGVGEALPITGTWPQGTILAMVGSGTLPTYSLPLAGQELSLSQYGSLYEALRNTLGVGLPKTDSKGMEGTTHFLLPNYEAGKLSIPGSMGVGFGGWLVRQPGKDYTIEWLVVVE